MFDLFAHDPQRYFHKLQARSVLFDETSIVDRPMSIGWLIFGFYVLVGLVCSTICGYLAVSRALDPLPWFFAALVGNVAVLIVLMIAPKGDPTAMPAGVPAGLAKVPTTRAPVRCPACGAENHPSASPPLRASDAVSAYPSVRWTRFLSAATASQSACR